MVVSMPSSMGEVGDTAKNAYFERWSLGEIHSYWRSLSARRSNTSIGKAS